MEKVRPWCGQPSDQGRLKNRTEQVQWWKSQPNNSYSLQYRQFSHINEQQGLWNSLLFVHLSVPSINCRSSMWQVCCYGSCLLWAGNINQFRHQHGHLSINIYSSMAISSKSSVMLPAAVECWTQTWLWLIDRLSCGFTSNSTQNRSFRRRFPQANLSACYDKIKN